ncbi:MAG: polyprenyl synthetase family protein [Ruminococcaceae bacterium]|nr:polyprenyl synthetase family protein [Oscillospiraceae bacterium]
MVSWLRRILSLMINDFQKLLKENTEILEKELEKYIDVDKSYGLSDVMSYSLLNGGKRLRPFIVIEASKLFSKEFDINRALPFACALEMIQTYSLIHDDLPCMDNDDYRRGKLTNHKVFGEDKALLAGDSLLTYAFEVLASNTFVSDYNVRLATVALAKYAGFSGMAGGQMIDLNSAGNINSYEELKQMHALKTSALIKCAVVLGYLSAVEKPKQEIIDDLEKYAENIGIAFQIKDDILDKTSTSEELGKPVGSDEKNGKTTSLTFMSIENAENEVKALTDEAIKIIEKYYKNESQTHSLVELAKYMVSRKK